jgi:hypothetical protein
MMPWLPGAIPEAATSMLMSERNSAPATVAAGCRRPPLRAAPPRTTATMVESW